MAYRKIVQVTNLKLNKFYSFDSNNFVLLFGHQMRFGQSDGKREEQKKLRSNLSSRKVYKFFLSTRSTARAVFSRNNKIVIPRRQTQRRIFN